MLPSTRLFVGNLPENIKDEDLVSAFSVFGKVTNLDLNVKTEGGKESTKFAFVTLSAPNVDVESCIQHFSNEAFHSNMLYVTVARESFLESLQRGQDEAQKKDMDDKFMRQESLYQKNLVLSICDKINSEKLNRSAKWSWRTSKQCHNMGQQNVATMTPINLSEKFNPRKRKIEHNRVTETESKTRKYKEGNELNKGIKIKYTAGNMVENKMKNTCIVTADRKKQKVKNKLLESMKSQNVKKIDTNLSSLNRADEVQNKRVKFPDFDELLKELENNKKKVSKQVTIHWIRVYEKSRILHRLKQDLMHSPLSLASNLSD